MHILESNGINIWFNLKMNRNEQKLTAFSHYLVIFITLQRVLYFCHEVCCALRPHGPHKVYIFLIRATSWVDIAMSVCLSVCLSVRLPICLFLCKLVSQFWNYLDQTWYRSVFLLHAVHMSDPTGSDYYII